MDNCPTFGGHTTPRGNAVRDALRHTSMTRRTIKIGRRASRTSCPRGA
ncbi:DUF1534 domain-containing protein [Pseudomonas syringae pv. avii]|nr:DUF1534 domain-containing protein [Pseudomonas syringae pv. avii]